ncbi:hypothetical protein [Herminiimonas fonticola]|uniref:Uncharacterized protein n=1 Tax=Herminiimonas fonticola TaxID=303380 RepID=A0A4R6G5N7_9BURK|nr:hypothetical protein [Herminiimonas fonticola]RBA23827.1 hypothetical protein Hfont_1639 [Herminiimonas fonticola]TDN89829.1 hypothetical protein EV677_1893 [Herminiimonas fonticola]
MNLSNRELSTLIWLAVFTTWVMLNASVRSSIPPLIRAICQGKVLASLLLAGLWIILSTTILKEVGLWNWENLKTTLVWALTFGFVTFFNLSRISEDHAYFKKTTRDIFRVTVAITFIMELYSFPMIVELLLVPFLALFTALSVFTERKPEYAVAHKISFSVLVTAGCFYLLNGLYQAINDFTAFASIANLREFTVPLFLSLLYLPFIYFLKIYMAYESGAPRITSSITDKKLQLYAKRKAITSFALDTQLIELWTHELYKDSLTSKAQVLKSIQALKDKKYAEAHPPVVAREDGWSPYLARLFCSDDGLVAGNYRPQFDEKWFANSPMLELSSDDILPNNIAYYIEGDEHCAKKLTIKLNVNTFPNKLESEKYFQDLCVTLLKAAKVESDSVTETLGVNKKGQKDIFTNTHRISLIKENFKKKHRGYSQIFVIETL